MDTQPTSQHLTHLTDEQFTHLLLGTNPPSVREHLKTCSQCSQEAERVSGAIGSFQQETMLWAERRAGSRPPITAASRPAFSWLHLPVTAQAWTAAALTLALATGIGIEIHRNNTLPAQHTVAAVQPTAPAAPATPATLKSDNELLSAIDGELRADASTPASLYGLTVDAHHSRTKAPKRIAD
jgi:hypothetical protein